VFWKTLEISPKAPFILYAVLLGLYFWAGKSGGGLLHGKPSFAALSQREI